jgi:hypothetical protein
VRRSGGFDVPDFLAAGPRDILVPRGGEDAARSVLGTEAGAPPRPPRPRQPPRRWVQVLALVLAALVIALVATGVIAAILGA